MEHEFIYYKVNPHTGDEEALDIRTEFSFNHNIEDNLIEINNLRIFDAWSSLPIHEALPYWTEVDDAVVRDIIKRRLYNPFIYQE